MAPRQDRCRLRVIVQVAGLAVALILIAAAAFGQSLDGRREQVTTAPAYRGTTANAPVPPEMHQANRNTLTKDPLWGGCVPSSVVTAARFHGFTPREIDAFWRLAMRRVGRGGTDRQLLAEMLRLKMPGRKWVDYMGPDARTALDQLSGKGYAVCSTMSWGDQYTGRIHHWVNLAHFDSSKDLACFIDNNDVGRYHWITAREFAARALDGGIVWTFAFTDLPAKAVKLTLVAAAVVMLSSTLLLFGGAGAFSLSLPPRTP